MRHSRKNRSTAWIIALAVALTAALVIWQFWIEPPANPSDANTPGGTTDANAPAGRNGTGDANTPANPNDGTSQDANTARAAMTDISAPAAIRLVEQGEQLLSAGKKVEGRAVLTKALLSDSLSQASANTVRSTLEDLANKMIFSREITPGDPYVASYTFAPGEVLQRVERKLELHVPNQITLKINKLTSGPQIRGGQTLKVIRGPFHAIVDKSDFTMDIILHREGLDPVFVKRLRVGLGKNGSTPLGLWRIRLGSKRDRAPWYPPASSEEQYSIRWDQPGYPLGKKGYWIGLEGIEKDTEFFEGYGIHGTNDQLSIGKASSLGCIRLADGDIDLVFSLLYEHWSTVRVRQ